MTAINTHATIVELLEAVFYVRSVSRLYKEGELPIEESLKTAVRRVGYSSETLASR
jgi:hypothetical protein